MARCKASAADSEVCISGESVLDADVMRYDYAYRHGGVYHDDDADFIVPPVQWPGRYPHLAWDNASLVVGIEFPRARGTGPSGCCLQFVQWTFAAARGSSVLGEVARRAKKNAVGGRVDDAVRLTGPLLFTTVILEHIGHVFDLEAAEATGAEYVSIYGERIIVLPYRAFGIHPFHQNVRRRPLREQLVQHNFLGRWRNERGNV